MRLCRSRNRYSRNSSWRLANTQPLASCKSVKLSELATVPLLICDRGVGPAVYDRTLTLVEAAAVRPRGVNGQPPPCAQAVMRLVASGKGYYVGIANPFTQTHRGSGVAAIPIDEPDARLDVQIAWREGERYRSRISSARDLLPMSPEWTSVGS